MKNIILSVLLSVLFMFVHSQTWLKKGATFHYTGKYMVWDKDDHILKNATIKNFSVKIKSIVQGVDCTFLQFNNFFDFGINDDNRHEFYTENSRIFIAIYKNCLYKIFFKKEIPQLQNISFKKILENQYANIVYDKQLNLLPNKIDSNSYRTSRFDNHYKIDLNAVEAFFVKDSIGQGKFNGQVNVYRSVDNKGYFNDTIIYSNNFFFTKFIKNVTRTPNPYRIELNLYRVNNNFGTKKL